MDLQRIFLSLYPILNELITKQPRKKTVLKIYIIFQVKIKANICCGIKQLNNALKISVFFVNLQYFINK